MLSALIKKLFGLGRSDGGNVMLVVALAGAVLVTAIGVAIDMSRTNLVRQNQQNAIDIAERAANNYCTHNATAAKNATNMRPLQTNFRRILNR